MNNSIKFEKVYYYLVDGVLEFIAIRPEIDFDDSFILWYEKGKQHVIWFHSLDSDFSDWEDLFLNPPVEISVKDEDGHHIIFKELTLERYTHLVEPKLHLGLNFKSDSEVQHYFLDSA